MTTTSSSQTTGNGSRSVRNDSQSVDEFERHRCCLTGLAYRMLGSMTEAEDAVQETYIRWHRTERSDINSVRAFLSRTVAHICLDQIKSPRAQRETYIGSWLPEPVLDAEALAADTASEYAADLSVGLMLALERLSPLERLPSCCMTCSTSTSRKSRICLTATSQPAVSWPPAGAPRPQCAAPVRGGA